MAKVLFQFVREQFNVRSNKDKRKKVNRVVVAYKDNNGDEYRKSYEFPTSYTFDKMKAKIPTRIQ